MYRHRPSPGGPPARQTSHKNVPTAVLPLESVISRPAHGETLALAGVDGAATYALQGYAYSGGGRKVIRVETSLDGGMTWVGVDAIEQHPAGPTAAGKYWCWCFWRHEVSAARASRRVASRAAPRSSVAPRTSAEGALTPLLSSSSRRALSPTP